MQRFIHGSAVSLALLGAISCSAEVPSRRATPNGVDGPAVGAGANSGALLGAGGSGSGIGNTAMGGSGVGSGSGGTGIVVVDPGAPGITVIRRLNIAEYNNTVRDLLADTSAPAKEFPPEEQSYGFNNNAAALTVSPVLVQAQLTAAETLSAALLSNLTTLLPCAATADDACAQQFIASFGERAFRHPLEQTDTDRLTAVFSQGKAAGGFNSGIEWVIQAMLMSPRFLYRVELSSATLDSWEVASRLSYMLWQTMPDASLLDAARTNTLTSPTGVASQAERLLADPKAKATLKDFHSHWLKYGAVQSLTRDAAIYPDFTPKVAQAMRQELDEFVTYAAFDSSTTVQTLFAGTESFLNGPLAAFYGVTGATGDAFTKVALDPAQRTGILTRGGIMAALSHPDQTSPVLRGKFIREQFFCQDVPPPPPSVVNKLPEAAPTFNARDRMVQHSQDPTCAACHQTMDPIGFSLENLDMVGRWRDTDGGKPVDATGDIVGTDTPGAFNGPTELAARLAASPQVNACVTTQFFRFATGRKETAGDAPAIAEFSGVLSSQGRLTKLVVALAESNTLRSR
ncbi:MAG: DUF1592 domain-containing protein [Polyangiaceae bacterium]|nr:DUF1592 domain-containing protein [Polyangiaceae bacterium]